MKKIIISCAAISLVLCLFCAEAYTFYPMDFLFSAAVTFGAVFFHICMRYAASIAADFYVRRTPCRPVRLSRAEKDFCRMIHIKSVKKHAPTYDKTLFSLRLHKPCEVYSAMRSAMVGHALSILPSFVPVLFSPIFGGFWAFLITSFLAALLDAVLIIIQRYNMSRLCRMVF